MREAINVEALNELIESYQPGMVMLMTQERIAGGIVNRITDDGMALLCDGFKVKPNVKRAIKAWCEEGRKMKRHPACFDTVANRFYLFLSLRRVVNREALRNIFASIN